MISTFQDIQMALENITQPTCKTVSPSAYLEYLIASFVLTIKQGLFCFSRKSLVDEIKLYICDVLYDCYPTMNVEVVKHWIECYVHESIPLKITIDTNRAYKENLTRRFPDYMEILQMSSTPVKCIDEYVYNIPSGKISCTPCSEKIIGDPIIPIPIPIPIPDPDPVPDPTRGVLSGAIAYDNRLLVA